MAYHCPRCKALTAESDLAPEPVAYTMSRPVTYTDADGIEVETWARREVRKQICKPCAKEAVFDGRLPRPTWKKRGRYW